jgi:hypothetical protein
VLPKESVQDIVGRAVDDHPIAEKATTRDISGGVKAFDANEVPVPAAPEAAGVEASNCKPRDRTVNTNGCFGLNRFARGYAILKIGIASPNSNHMIRNWIGEIAGW